MLALKVGPSIKGKIYGISTEIGIGKEKAYSRNQVIC